MHQITLHVRACSRDAVAQHGSTEQHACAVLGGVAHMQRGIRPTVCADHLHPIQRSAEHRCDAPASRDNES